ncbi:hypothetical protein BsWGS_09208 [Bradybaena similaris]
MWPMLVDYTKDESKRILRRLELEAYASIVSVFRAQGDLSKEKKKTLQDLQQMLSISTERHRAEVRRAINDEKLATIADNIAGTISAAEWMIEGRRLVPLMPRLVPQTTFTATANQAASAMMEKNASLPPPSQTWNKDGPVPILLKPSRPASPSSNVVFPSGTSIHIKGMLSQDEDDELSAGVPSRRSSNRSLSSDSQNAASVSTQTPRVTYTTASSTLPGSSPVKITISKSPQGRPITVQSGSQPPKVILVTSAGSASGSTVIQRSMSVPVVRTPPTTLSTYSGTGPPRSSVLVPGGSSASGPQVVSSFPGVVTSSSSSTSLASTTVTVPSAAATSSPALLSPSVHIGFGKVRPRLVPRQRYPSMVPQQKPGVVIPMGPQLVSPPPNSASGNQVSQPQQSTASIQVTSAYPGASGLQMKTLNKPTIQIKQEGGMKIITQSNTSKILPKPSQISGSAGTPVVMVNTAQSTSGNTPGVTLLPRSVSSYTAHSGGKVLNITTPGGRVIATTTKATNVVTVNPKTLHLTAVKSGLGSTTVSKPNVIVVQKTQHTRFQSPLGQGGTNIRTITTSSLPGAIDKELMGLVHKDSQGRHVLSTSSPSITTTSTGRGGERRVIITTSGGGGEIKQPVSIIHRGRADSEGKTSSLLAELIQAAGIMPSDGVVETAAQGTDPYDFDNTEGLTQLGTTTVSLTTSTIPPHQISRLPLQWHTQNDGGEDDANTYGKGNERRESQDSDLGTEHVFTIEPGISLLNKEGVNLEVDIIPTSSVSSAHPVTYPPTSIIPSISQLLTQPKVSILSTAKTFINDTNREAAVTIQTQETSLARVLVSPEEGLKEGQLDTQTGLFCQVSAAEKYSGANKVAQSPAPQALPVVSLPPSSVTSVLIQAEPGPSSSSSSLSLNHPPLDLLSSSLAEAQINLDSFNDDDDDYEEEDDLDDDNNDQDEGQTHLPLALGGQIINESVVAPRPGMAEVLREETAKDGTRILTVSNPASLQQEAAVIHSNLLVSLPSQLSRSSTLPPSMAASASSSSSSPASAYITIQEVARTALGKTPTSVSLVSHAPATTCQKSNSQTSILPIAVSVESSPSVITLKLDDLTNRTEQDEDQRKKVMGKDAVIVNTAKLKEPDFKDLSILPHQESGVNHPDDVTTGSSDADTHSDGPVSSDQSALVRSSKRKRKHPSGLEEPLQAAAPGSWVKVAASLLLKVAKFKGSPRDKNEIPAAEWFTFPVDPLDAPDYYTVIQTPMDFSTMRKKLETGQYGTFEDFQLDMDLIRTNCYLYNSEGTKVRRDCDEVMVFYKSELAKLQEKHLNKAFMQNSSPLKRSKMEDKISQKPLS